MFCVNVVCLDCFSKSHNPVQKAWDVYMMRFLRGLSYWSFFKFKIMIDICISEYNSGYLCK